MAVVVVSPEEHRPLVRDPVADALATQRTERDALADVAAHGAPSARWVREQRRAGRIQILGPRGRQYVTRAALEELLAAAVVRRLPPVRTTTLAEDAAAEVVQIASARIARGAR